MMWTRLKSKINEPWKYSTKFTGGRQAASGKSSHNKDMELPNLVTAVAVQSNSINFINIWDLTIYQFYEQFKKTGTHKGGI